MFEDRGLGLKCLDRGFDRRRAAGAGAQEEIAHRVQDEVAHGHDLVQACVLDFEASGSEVTLEQVGIDLFVA